MLSIVEQFRALRDIGPISNAYWFNEQRYASKMFLECVNIKDDEILLERLREHAFAFVNALQIVPVSELTEWRAFLRELIKNTIDNDVLSYSVNGIPDWRDQSRRMVALTRLGNKPNFSELRYLITQGVDRLPNVASFASDCRNVPAIGKTLPNITRDIVETGGAAGNVVIWLNLVEIYTRLYQGRDLHKNAKYAQLIEHLSKYKCASKDQLQTWNNKPTDSASVTHDYVLYFLERVKCADYHLAATFLCDNIKAFDEFDRQCGTKRLSSLFIQTLGIAAMLQTGETEMNEQKPRKLGDLMPKPSKCDDIGRQIDELNENIRQLNAEWSKMREAAAKLRASIAKSKKLIADWEC